jgi:hypothetical protein
MRPFRLPAKSVAPLNESERRHYALLIEAMSKQGRSEGEIVAALEQAMSTNRRLP